MEQCWIFEQLLRKHQKKLSFGSHYDLIHVSQGLLEGRVDPNGLVVRVAVGQLVDVPLEYVRQHARRDSSEALPRRLAAALRLRL